MLAPPTPPTFRVGADVNDDSSHVDVLPKVLCPVRQRVYRRGAGVRAVFGWSAGAPTSIEVAVDGVSRQASSSRAGHPRGRCRGQASRPHVITMPVWLHIVVAQSRLLTSRALWVGGWPQIRGHARGWPCRRHHNACNLHLAEVDGGLQHQDPASGTGQLPGRQVQGTRAVTHLGRIGDDLDAQVLHVVPGRSIAIK